MPEQRKAVVLRAILAGDVVPETRQKKWCRTCHGTHALPECGLPTNDPEPLVIDARLAGERWTTETRRLEP